MVVGSWAFVDRLQGCRWPNQARAPIRDVRRHVLVFNEELEEFSPILDPSGLALDGVEGAPFEGEVKFDPFEGELLCIAERFALNDLDRCFDFIFLEH